MKNNYGISLIVLIITIIIIILLAGVVILSLTNNSPIDAAAEAVFKSTTREYVSGLDMTVMSNLANGIDQSNLEASSTNIKEYIPQIKDSDKNKFNIRNGELAYIGVNSYERKWINEMNVLNGNPPIMQEMHVPHTSATDESIISAKITKGGKYVTITGITISSQRYSYINLIDEEYNLEKRVEVYLDNNTYFRELVILSNGNIAVTGYIRNSSDTVQAIMLLYTPSLDELKREIYAAPKTGYESYGSSIVNTASGGYMVINSAERYNASYQIIDAYACMYSYDSNGNKILNNVEIRGLDGSLFMLYDAELSPNGNIYLCGNDYKNNIVTPRVLGINMSGQVVYEYILDTVNPYGEYRYMTILSDGTLVLDRIECTSTSGNPYNTAIETIDYLNVKTNEINNIDLNIPVGLPKIRDINRGYNDDVFVVSLDVSGQQGIFKYEITKLSKNGDVRWTIVSDKEQTNVVLRLLHTDKNKYIVFGQYKAASDIPYASYIAELIP